MTGSLRAMGVLFVLRLLDEGASGRSGAFDVVGFPILVGAPLWIYGRV